MFDLNVKISGIDKLFKHFARGIGAIFPMLVKRKAQLDADVQLIKAQGDVNVIRLFCEKFGIALSPIQGESEAVEKIKTHITFQEEKRQRNIETVVRMAAEEIKDKEVQDHEIDHDWTARFFSDVQDVSSEQMQQIWAKILAGEVETPGRTSFRTLAILKNMTKKDAELFSKVAQFVIGDFVFSDSSTDEFDGFPSYDMFIQLESYGLINAGTLVKKLTREHAIADKFRAYRISKETHEAGDNWKVDIPCYVLTPAGKEIYQFVEVQTNMNYLGVFANFLKENNAKLEYADIPRDQGKDSFDILPLLKQVQPRPIPKPDSNLAS